jgi:hypothetical protein
MKQRWFSEKINTIDKYLAKLIKEKTKINKLTNENRNLIRDITEIQILGIF